MGATKLHALSRMLSGTILFLNLYSLPMLGGEVNLAGIFSGFKGDDSSEQRQLEQRLESELAKFRSVESASILIPIGEAAKQESLWGNSDPRILPVEVVLKLKKPKRLTQKEFQSITNLVSSGLSERNRVVQVVVRDVEGYEWSDESPETLSLFKVASVENEMSDKLTPQWVDEISWQEFTAVPNGSCSISGTYLKKSGSIPMEIRSGVMNVLQGICKTARIKIVPSVSQAGLSQNETLLWIERLSFVMIGFAVFGIGFLRRKYGKNESKETKPTSDDDAIILTKIVERSPDEAAKWMVRALLSDSDSQDSEEEKNKQPPQIFDQPS